MPLFIPHAGCPNQCVFCNQKRISGSLFPVSAQDVEKALLALGDVKNYELAFYGGSFTAIPIEEQEALLKAVQPFRQSGKISSIRISTRPDAIDWQRLELLQSMGVTTIELGAQSMNNDVLLQTCRGHSAERVVASSQMIRAKGFSLVLQMMTGLPGESDESAMESAKKIIQLKPDAVRIYPTVIVKDTPLYDSWLQGEYTEHTLEQAVALCARLLPLFQRANIPVIRLGLNPTEELSGGQAAGGAYHPALGEMVLSRMRRDECEKLLSPCFQGKDVAITVPKKLLSQYVGQKKANLVYLRDKFALQSLVFLPQDRENVPAEIAIVEKK